MPSLVVETATLLISEIFSNAVSHGTGVAILEVEIHPDRMRVSVYDEGSGVPRVQRRASADAEHGRGLFLVETLSARWGVDPQGGVGKSVWFELDRA